MDSHDNNLNTKELNAEILLQCNHESELTHCTMISIMRNITNEKAIDRVNNYSFKIIDKSTALCST